MLEILKRILGDKTGLSILKVGDTQWTGDNKLLYDNQSFRPCYKLLWAKTNSVPRWGKYSQDYVSKET